MKFPKTKEALVEYEAGLPKREKMFADAGSDEEIAVWQAAEAEAHRKVGLAFFEDTQEYNSKENCLLASIEYLRKLVADEAVRETLGEEAFVSVPVRAVAVDLQPGDGTHYRFLISEVPSAEGRIAISGREGVRFKGYDYEEDEVRYFFERNGKPSNRGDYREWALRAISKNDHYLLYVQEHSAENPWTALAALVSMGLGTRMLGSALAVRWHFFPWVGG